MNETAAGRLRIGKGSYTWHFTGQVGVTRASALHIHIDRMDAFADESGVLRRTLQSALPYPWLPPAVLRERFEQLINSRPAFEFLIDFKTPYGAARV
jgi:hypothetical protein